VKRCASQKLKQRGLAMVALIAVIVVGATFLLVRSLNAATWKSDRYRITTEALAKAKEALIARSVADDNRPGSLPCPDTDDDGDAELFAGNACPSYIGRLPWRSLQLADLRDASGERLWYVLSPSHRDHPAAQPINSNTVGQISLTGTAAASGALAVVIAPGAVLTRVDGVSQSRSCPANCNNALHYLDRAGAIDNAVASATHVSALESPAFNDRLLAILPDDIMPLVEKRAAREVASRISSLYSAWQTATGRGFYPWAAPFVDPGNPGTGLDGRLHGLLPVTATALQWTSASTSLGSCTGTGTQTLECIALVAGPLTITASVSNVATRFLAAPAPPLVIGAVVGESITWALNPVTQRLDFTYRATVVGAATVRAAVPALSAWAPSAWLTGNQWNRVIYYALSQDHAITGNGTCTTACLAMGGVSNKEAALIMTGRALPGALPPQANRAVATPPAALTDYLEGGNADLSDLALERGLRTAAFNDQVIAIRP
jgi:hypothetical protein